MASDVTKDPQSGDVVEVQLDEVIAPGDPRHGIHNPEVGPSDTLAVHDESVDTDAIQVDIPQTEPNPSDSLYLVDPDEQASQQAAAAESAKKPSSKSDSDKS